MVLAKLKKVDQVPGTKYILTPTLYETALEYKQKWQKTSDLGVYRKEDRKIKTV